MVSAIHERYPAKNDTMKILSLSYLYPNSLYPNYGIFVHNRLKALSRYHEIKVINPIPWFPGCGRLARYRHHDRIPARENIAGLDVFHPRFPIIPRYCKLIDAITYRAAVMKVAARLYRTFPFQLIDLHWTYPDLPSGDHLSRKFRKDYIVTLRGKEAFYHGEGWLRQYIVTRYLSGASHIIGLSQELCDMAVAGGYPRQRTTVIRNGVDENTFYYLDQQKCRDHLHLAPDTTILLSVCSLLYSKGLDRIIKALPALIQQYPNLRCYIIGKEGPEGNFKRKLLTMAHTLKVNKKVIFVGEVNNRNLNFWYNAADMFVLASRGEGSPNVLTEALAAGCPCLATSVGAVPDIISSRQFGIICPNTDDIAPFLTSILAKRFHRPEISAENRKRNWDWCARKTKTVIDQFAS